MIQLENTLEALVNFECGVITYVSAVPGQPCEPDLQIYVAEYQDPGALHSGSAARVPSVQRQTSGAGLTREEALWATIGEAVERYSASNWRWRESEYGPAHAMPRGREFLERAVLYAEADYALEGFPYHRPDPSIPHGWLIGRDLLTGEPASAPSSLCCMHYVVRGEDEILDRAYSTGLACHGSASRAALVGLYELVERDAFTCYWLAGVTPSRLSRGAVEARLPDKLAGDLRRLALAYSVFALRTDVAIPVFVAILELPGGGIATGAAAGLDSTAALRKAVVECLHTYNWCLEMKRLDTKLDAARQIHDFRDHVAWYLDPARARDFRWRGCFAEEDDTPLAEWATPRSSDPAGQLREATERVGACGTRPFVVDMTPPDMASIGFHVARVFAPGLQPLSAGYRNVHTDLRRLNEFTGFLGVEAPRVVSYDPPHSFP